MTYVPPKHPDGLRTVLQ